VRSRKVRKKGVEVSGKRATKEEEPIWRVV